MQHMLNVQHKKTAVVVQACNIPESEGRQTLDNIKIPVALNICINVLQFHTHLNV